MTLDALIYYNPKMTLHPNYTIANDFLPSLTNAILSLNRVVFCGTHMIFDCDKLHFIVQVCSPTANIIFCFRLVDYKRFVNLN